MNKNKLMVIFGILMLSWGILSGCGKKKTSIIPTPTPLPREIELAATEKPNISLIPREDGHLLKLKISGIPASIKAMEYEVIYRATDSGNEIEKGVGDTIKDIKGGLVEKDILLGTESCTSGCKYKYDEGVESGSVNLILITEDGSTATLEAPFVIRSTADIKKAGGILMEDGFTVKAIPASNEFFVAMRNTGLNGKESGIIYSIFSSGSGKGKVNSIIPEGTVKEDKNIIKGDYWQN